MMLRSGQKTAPAKKTSECNQPAGEPVVPNDDLVQMDDCMSENGACAQLNVPDMRGDSRPLFQTNNSIEASCASGAFPRRLFGERDAQLNVPDMRKNYRPLFETNNDVEAGYANGALSRRLFSERPIEVNAGRYANGRQNEVLNMGIMNNDVLDDGINTIELNDLVKEIEQQEKLLAENKRVTLQRRIEVLRIANRDEIKRQNGLNMRTFNDNTNGITRAIVANERVPSVTSRREIVRLDEVKPLLSIFTGVGIDRI